MSDERKTRLCRQCYETIDVRARVCPHCRRSTGKGLVSDIKWKFVELAFAVLATVCIYFAIQFAFRYIVRGLSAQTQRSNTTAVQTHKPQRR